MSSAWGLLAILCFIAAWIVSVLVESLTAIIVALVGGLFSVAMAAVANRHPRVAQERARQPQPPAKAPQRALRQAQPVSKPRKRPPCSDRCRKSTRSKHKCQCVCGGETHGSARL